VANTRYVTPGYFAAVGTPVLQGRVFTAADAPSAPRVTVVDETLARLYWPNGDAVGKRVRHGGDTTAGGWMTIVGIVPNVRHESLAEEPSLQVYEPFAQGTPWTMYLVVRVVSDPEALLPALRAQVAAIDPEIPLYEVRTMEQAVSRSLATRRLTNVLLAAFATAAFVLAAIGIYGVIAIGVAARTREFGVRMALGARSANVLVLVLRRGVLLAAVGIGIGLLGAVWAVRFLRGLLFGVSAFDLPTFAIATAVLGVIALVACLIPARRATVADPLTALRAD
jgi:predicted permease